jgi:hypothetical protein
MRKVGATLIGLWIAICVLAALGSWGFCLDRTVKPIDLALLFVNLFIAVFLQYYLATQITDLRAEKNLLIDEIRESASMLKRIREYCDRDKLAPEEKRLVLPLLRTFANSLEGLETALMRSQLAHLLDSFQSLKNAYFNYKSVLTGGNFPNKILQADARSDHNRAYRNLNSEIQSLVFKINKHR